MRHTRATLLAAALVLAGLTGQPVLAPPPGGGNGNGNGNGNGGGGGGDDPAPDPAIVYHRSKGSLDLKVMNLDGSNQTLLVENTTGGRAISGDGTFVAFFAELDGLRGVWTIGTDGAGLELVTPTLGAWSGISVSPVPTVDGEYKIAFGDSYDMWLVNLDGTGLQQLTDTELNERAPHWSMDGTRLVITRNVPPSCCSGPAVVLELDLVDGAIQIVDDFDLWFPGSPLEGADMHWPSWANGDDRIVVSADTAYFYELWIIDLADPANPLQVTFGDLWAKWPAFSPDDAHLIYNREGQGVLQLDLATGSESLINRHAAIPDVKRWPSQ